MQTLSEYLAANGITQQDFARRLGVAQSHISRLCRAAPTLSPELALRIDAETSGRVPVGVWPQYKPLFDHSRSTSSAPLAEAAE